MPLSCVAYGCNNRQKRPHEFEPGEKKITFHRFPTKDKRLRHEWESAVRRKNVDGSSWQASKWSVLCSAHFRDEDFTAFVGYPHKRSTLKDGIVPSVFKAYPPRLQRIVERNYQKYKKEHEARAKADLEKSIQDKISDVMQNFQPKEPEKEKPVGPVIVKDHYDHCYFIVRPGFSLERDVIKEEDENAKVIQTLKNQIVMLQDKLERKDKIIRQLKDVVYQSKRDIDEETLDDIQFTCKEVLEMSDDDLDNSGQLSL